MVYTVRKLANISGVSVRTLHYYDEVDLLKPAYIGANGYRHYEEAQLLQLQQILFFRKLGMELNKIRQIIKKDDFSQIAALHSHRKLLARELENTRELIETIDNTIKHLQGQKKMKDKQFFEGLNSPKQTEYEKYLVDSGNITAQEIERGRKRLEKWSKEDWADTQKEWEDLLKSYVKAIQEGHGPESKIAHALVERHFKYLNRFGIEVKREEMVEKSQFYLGHPDWIKLFDSHHPKLHGFMLAAIEDYSKQ
ncbi:MAG: MerR family transcriptional regulator [Parachlamydiales bacterium]|nr:MerR family transcriptional regulator [Parachlamydiales bacterium]